jgi:hypothetical protein
VSIERDHHELVVGVDPPEEPQFGAASVVVGMLFIGLAISVALLVGLWGLAGLLPLLLLESWLVARALRVLDRTRLRLSSEYLVLERRSPLRKPEITRIALGSIRKIEREWGSLRLKVEGLGLVVVPCPPSVEAEVLDALQQAIADAPAPTLRKVGPPPRAIEELRSSGGS